jgi:hypothetical protein
MTAKRCGQRKDGWDVASYCRLGHCVTVFHRADFHGSDFLGYQRNEGASPMMPCSQEMRMTNGERYLCARLSEPYL